MLVKTITYTDYNGEDRTEEFRFNLTQSELIAMENGISGGLSDMLKRIVAAKDYKKMMEIFHDILLKAYGEKTPDGRQFVKSKELSEAFSQTEAYDKLFVELISDDQAAAQFMKAILPPSLPK